MISYVGTPQPPRRVFINPVNPLFQSIYEDAETFKGFRFAEMRDSGSDDLAQFRHQMISPEVNYLPFGYGRHAWLVPGYTLNPDLFNDPLQPWEVFRSQ